MANQYGKADKIPLRILLPSMKVFSLPQKQLPSSNTDILSANDEEKKLEQLSSLGIEECRTR